MSGAQNSEKVKLLISKLRKFIKTTVNIDDLLPTLDEFYHFLTTESKQLPASKVKNFILKVLILFKSAIKANKFIDDNETKIIYKHKLCKIISFYIDVELFSVGIGKDSSDNITNRISTTMDSYFNEPENILKIFRASLQIKKGKQIMKFKDIVIALFTKYFYRQARAQPLIIDDVQFLEQLSIYKIWISLLDSQAHKDELIEMVINYMVPLNKQILMSQLGITDADNFMNEALKTTSQQVMEKAIINNTEIIDLDPDPSDSHVPSNVNDTLLNDLQEQTIEKVCKPIIWLDNLSMKTTEKLIEKRVIIEIDDDDDDDIEMVDSCDTANVVIDLNVVKNLSLDDKTVAHETNEIIDEAVVKDKEGEEIVQTNDEGEENIQNNNETFLKSDIPRTYGRKEKTDIVYKSSIDTMEIGTMTDLIAHTKETEMCVENEMSSTEPDMSQSEIDNHLASSPLKVVKSFTCPLPSHPLFEINSIRQPESTKICIMERKTYIREEETPIYDYNTTNTQVLNDDSISLSNDLFRSEQSNEPVVDFNSSQTTLNLANNTHLINTNSPLFPLEPMEPVNPAVFSTPSTFFSTYNYPLLKQNELKPTEILHSTEPEVETTLPFKKRRTMSIYVECPNRKEYESCESLQSTKKSPIPSDQQIVEPCSNIVLNTSYPSTPMISIATIAHLLHENNPTTCQQQNVQNTHPFEVPIMKVFPGKAQKAQNHFNNLVAKPTCVPTSPEQHFYHKNNQLQHNANPPIDYQNYHAPEPIVNSNNYFKSIDFKSGSQHSLAGSGNIQSNSRGITLPSSSRHQDNHNQSIRDHNQSTNSKSKTKSSSKRATRQKSIDTKDYDLNDEPLRKDADKHTSNKVSNYVVKSRENPQISNLNLYEKTLEYEVSPCRNRINGIIKLVNKPQKKSVRFADEVPTNHTIPLITYGRIVDCLLYRSFVRLERNTTCEKLVRKMLTKTQQQTKKYMPNKKSLKVPEIPAWKNPQTSVGKIQKSILKPNDDENKKQLDICKLRKMELKNTRFSKRCASLNGNLNYFKSKNSVELTNNSSKTINHRRRTVYECDKDENIAETDLTRSQIKLMSKEQYSLKAKLSSTSLSNFNEIGKPVVDDEQLNDEQQKIINSVVDTTSKEDLGTCNKIIYSIKSKRLNHIKMNMPQISSSDDKVFENEEFKSDNNVEHKTIDSVEETDPNEAEMLCYVLSSSTEEINIEEELSELNNRPDLSVEKHSDESDNSADELTEEYHDSADEQSEEHHDSTDLLVDKCEKSVDQNTEKCDKSMNQLKEEYHNSTDVLVHECENQMDQQTEECDKSVNHLREEFDKSADQVSEECEKSVNQDQTEGYNEYVVQLNEDCDDSADQESEEFERPADEVTEGYNEFSRQLSNEHEETENHQIEEYNESAGHLSDENDETVNHLNESTEQLDDKHDESAEQLIVNYEETVNHQTEDYEKSVYQMTEECNGSAEQLDVEHDESAEQLIENYEGTVNHQTEDYDKSVDQMTEECNGSAEQLDDEHDESAEQLIENYEKTVNHQTEVYDKSVDQMTEECNGSAEQLDDEHDESAEQLSENYEETANHQTEVYDKSVDQMTEECNGSAEQLDDEHDESAEQLSEDNDKSLDQLSDEYDESADKITEDYDESPDQLTKGCVTSIVQIHKEYHDSTDQQNEDYDKSVDQSSDEYDESADKMAEDCEESAVQLTKGCVSSAQVTEKYDKSSDQLRNKSKESMDQMNDECVISVKHLSKICNKPAYQISADCYKSVEQTDDYEFVKSPVYSNLEHLEESEPGCNKYNLKTKTHEKAAGTSVIYKNNNDTGFDITAKANNNNAKIITNEDSDERNSFSPVQDQTEDKANNDAKVSRRDLTYLINSLYSNENENSKGEPIDLVTTGTNFNSNQTTLSTTLQTTLSTTLQTTFQTTLQTSLQTTIPPLKKRRKLSSHGELFIPKHFAMQPITSPVNPEVLATNNRVISLEESLPYVSSPDNAIRRFNLLQRFNADKFYLQNKQQQQQLLESQKKFKKAFNYHHDPRVLSSETAYHNQVSIKVQQCPLVQNSIYMTGYNLPNVPKSTSNYPVYAYDSRTTVLMQDQTINKVNVDTRNTASTSRSNHSNYPVLYPSTELTNYAPASSPGISREYNKRKSSTIVYPIYNRGPKKETQRLMATNNEHLSVQKAIDEIEYLKNIASTQSSNFLEEFVPYKRRQTVTPRNSKTTRFLEDQPIAHQEIFYPVKPIISIEHSNTSRYVQEQPIVNLEISYAPSPMICIANSNATQILQDPSIVDDDISYPSKPMMSIANTCTCDLQNYASCSLHPRNLEPEVQEYNSHPIVEGCVKAKSIFDLLPKPDQRYGNNSNEEVFDQLIPEFGVDELPGESGEFEEAYINYEAIKVRNYRKPRIRPPPKPQTAKSPRKPSIKPKTKSVPILTPYHFAMSPPNPPDSTTIQPQSCINKKRGRPKGSKNRVKSDGLYLTLAESVNPSRY